MVRTLVHPKMMASVSSFYPATCTIQEYTVTGRNDYNEEILVWADKPGHVDIPCAVSPSGGQEVKRDNMTYVVSTHRIALRGYYPEITEEMRVVSGGQVYDILLVEHDSLRQTTRLLCEVVR